MPEISIIVPVYNAQAYILDTLQSIADQIFADFEVLVVDDCSTDQSVEIVRNFCARDSRFRYLRSPSNCGGPAEPRNIGIAHSAGEYIAFCDADDLWAPFKLEVQHQVATETGADLVSAVVRDFNDGEAPDPLAPPRPPVPLSTISHRRLLVKNWIALSSVLARRSSLAAVGRFNPARSHVAVEDFDMWLRMASKGMKLVRVRAPLVHYRKLPTSLSASKTMMVRKAISVIGEDYARRGQSGLFSLLRPLHWILYLSASAWMRAVRREL